MVLLTELVLVLAVVLEKVKGCCCSVVWAGEGDEVGICVGLIEGVVIQKN